MTGVASGVTDDMIAEDLRRRGWHVEKRPTHWRVRTDDGVTRIRDSLHEWRRVEARPDPIPAGPRIVNGMRVRTVRDY